MKNRLKRRLRAGETVTAAWLELGTPEVAEILVRCGWDTLVVDCEHGVAGLEEGLGLIRAVEAAGGDAILRVPDGTDATLKRALDRGARSLIVPMVNTPAMARQVAAACRYPPMGTRGYAAPIVRASGYGEWTTYAAEANEEVFVAVQIEHRDALPHVADFASVPGIDMGVRRPERPRRVDGIPRTAGRGGGDERDRTGSKPMPRAAGLPLGTITGARSYAALTRDGYRLIVGPERHQPPGRRRAGRGGGARDGDG